MPATVDSCGVECALESMKGEWLCEPADMEQLPRASHS